MPRRNCTAFGDNIGHRPFTKFGSRSSRGGLKGTSSCVTRVQPTTQRHDALEPSHRALGATRSGRPAAAPIRAPALVSQPRLWA
eukprot:1726307-Prymnesium_polylepis.1